MDITQIPFHSHLGIERSSQAGFVFSLPNDEKYTNHLGIIHASALASLAEITSGECLLSLSKNLSYKIVPVVVRLDIRYKNRAEGVVHSRYQLSDEENEVFNRRLESRGKATLTVNVEVCDSEERQVLTGTVHYLVWKK